jgi:peptide deformylase
MSSHAHGHDHHHEHDHDDHDHDDDDHDHDDEIAGPDSASAEHEVRKQIALSQIRQYGDPVLRMKALTVETFDEELARVADRMYSIMHDAEGVGLAATQVGILRRMFVFVVDGEDHVLVNPIVTSEGKQTETDNEGCLSLGSVRVDVTRPLDLTIAGKDVSGNDVSYDLEGLGARVVQHELDHLDGRLVIDRTDEQSRRDALRQLRPRLVLR